MDLYRPVLFIHVTAIIGMFAALAIEWVTVQRLRRVTSYEQARDWTHVFNLLPAIGAPSAIAALVSGVYLATTLGVWRLGWVAVAIPTLIAVAVAGGLTAPSRKRVRVALGECVGGLPHDIVAQLRQKFWVRSLRVRTALLTGLVFEMTVKPDSGVWIIAAVATGGVAWSLATRS
jgi:hypothetical protein